MSKAKAPAARRVTAYPVLTAERTATLQRVTAKPELGDLSAVGPGVLYAVTANA